MRKLKLSPDTLRVESFGTAPSRDERGTVRGAEHTFGWECETFEHPWCGYQTVEYDTCGTHPGTGSGTGVTQCDTCFYASCDGSAC